MILKLVVSINISFLLISEYYQVRALQKFMNFGFHENMLSWLVIEPLLSVFGTFWELF